MAKKVYTNKTLGILCACGIVCSTLGGIHSISSNAASLYGDVNGDGQIGIADGVMLSKFLVGTCNVNDINMKNSDVDQNTAIDTNDAKILFSYEVHNISSLPYSETGITFNYDNYTIPKDEARNYIKYDCSSGSTSNYLLSVPAQSTTSRLLKAGNIDDRVLDSSNNAKAIVKLSYKRSDGKLYRGTGFIVDKHVIATCGHCLYDTNLNEFYKDYKVQIYNSEGTAAVATYSAVELHIPYYYYQNKDFDHDYGLIYVSEDLSKYGKVSLGLATDNFKNTSQKVYISGFPAYVNNSYVNNRYYDSGVALSTTNDYCLDTGAYVSGGNSGGPIYIENTYSGNTYRSAIAICGYLGNANPRYSGGVRITLPVLRFLLSNSNIG